MTQREEGRTIGACSRALAVARASLDGVALAFALAWSASWALGAWSWPLPIVLHAWSLAGPLFGVGAGWALARRRVGVGLLPGLGLLLGLLHVALLVAWSVQHAPRLLREPAAAESGTLPAAESASLTLVSLNAGNGRAAPDELARWAREQDADALFLQELDAAQAEALERECAAQYPFRELHGLGLRGMGVLSRWPLAGTRLLELEDGSRALFGRIGLPGSALAFADVHLSAWVALLGPWGAADESLARVLAELGAAEPALVAGDFNATSESPLFARVRAAGYVEAFDAAGCGLGLSFPVFLRYRGLPLPPLVRIDHVFLRGLEPRSAHFTSGAGADHRGLRVAALGPR